ncbi:hypothetical protein L873DRAFT_1812847 [Choiromyces venosus 120613-1]|uniref:Uncharacterized protein n=1 Tax=Choiromyces venosus 120613-1 TaxID=1336337 RepID=A0A3N4JGI7_9PEZI|nr:hypothetical protein L873DRAFT_1812847 [Choiromyces venosus 120613-1]
MLVLSFFSSSPFNFLSILFGVLFGLFHELQRSLAIHLLYVVLQHTGLPSVLFVYYRYDTRRQHSTVCCSIVQQ